jgi:magnesium transporter
MLHNPKTGDTRWGNEDLVTEWASNPELWIWADFCDEEPEHEKRIFSDVFDLNPLAISDAQRERHPPKLEAFGNYFFMLVHGMGAEEPSINFRRVQIALFVSERFLLTRHQLESVSIDYVWQTVEKGDVDITRGPVHVAYKILRRVTDRYTALIEGFEHQLELLEDEMFDNPRDALMEELLGYGKNLKKLRRIFNYHQNIFTRLSRKDHPFIGSQERHEYVDVFEHTERLSSLTTLYKELTDDMMNGYISVTSHRLNQIMKVLTIVTVIFLPLSLMVGIYGMNFDYIPELKAHYGYFVLLGVMATLTTTLLLLFRKIRWL